MEKYIQTLNDSNQNYFLEIASKEVKKIIEKEKRKWFYFYCLKSSSEEKTRKSEEWGANVANLRNKLCDMFSYQTEKIKQLSHLMPIERKPDIEFLDSKDYKEVEVLLREKSVTKEEFVQIVEEVQPEIGDLNNTKELNLVILKPAAIKKIKEYLQNRDDEWETCNLLLVKYNGYFFL